MNKKNERYADKLFRTTYQNPFSDIQARTFSDIKISSEFVPTSLFWTLFNDQHEVVIGTRGSGKTILMRMMRYSMLKSIHHKKARELVAEKKFFALYVPMRYEFIESISSPKLSTEQQDAWFCFAVNCLIADSLIVELKSLLSDYPVDEQLELEFKLTRKMSHMWGIDNYLSKADLNELRTAVRKIYNMHSPKQPLPESVPPVFLSSLCSALAAVNIEISNILHFSTQPTWIICVDEAEFLRPNQMNCISKVMRSESQHIAIKIADLPYYHDMSCPQGRKIHATVGNDYKLTLVKISEKEFITLTNMLCRTRLQPYYGEKEQITLETFVGSVGNDDYLDYFKAEFPKASSELDIRNGILSTISEDRRKTASRTTDEKVLSQSIFKKLAPIYYLREMYKRAQRGNSKPGWFAGAKMIRRISNGNPRLFLRIMDALFYKAQSSKLTPKIQSETLHDFSAKYCSETESLEDCGPEVAIKLKIIAEKIKATTHNDELKESGTTFRFLDSEFEKQRKWTEIAIANSRLFVDEISLLNGLTSNSVFELSNVYATYYWLPMRRNSNCPRISISESNEEKPYSYTITKPKPKSKQKEKSELSGQMKLFDEEGNANDH
ncbi:MAG: hypothetical protein MSO56_09115 [Clostridiales bacterium]|nr:hypothetical protein [Clostridiales bacterium]